jgi:CRP/FNR family cyclic AMP-dependent transcriptional regulator
MMRGLCERLRAADRSIESLALMDVYGRIARVLLDLAKPKDGRLVIEEPLTHKDIAQMVGSSREMVSRIFKDLATGGYISTEHKVITINSTLPRGW